MGSFLLTAPFSVSSVSSLAAASQSFAYREVTERVTVVTERGLLQFSGYRLQDVPTVPLSARELGYFVTRQRLAWFNSGYMNSVSLCLLTPELRFDDESYFTRLVSGWCFSLCLHSLEQTRHLCHCVKTVAPDTLACAADPILVPCLAVGIPIRSFHVGYSLDRQ